MIISEYKGWRGSKCERYTVQLVRPPCSSVELVDGMTDPVQMMAKVQNTYSGVLANELLPEEKVERFFEDAARTKLQTPSEMFYTVWLIKDVTRAFTHQAVRTRIGASFAQESMRFFGLHGVYKVMASQGITANATWLSMYAKSVFNAVEVYDELVEDGASSEDARGVLPTNICTALFFGCAFSTLQHIYEQRVCCQAQQGEWIPILLAMKRLLRERYGKDIAGMLKAPVELGRPCGYNASFDRPCKWKGKSDITESDLQ